MPSTEQDSALITQAAIEVGRERGLHNLPVALQDPLPEGQRQYLYTVSDTHPLSKVYGAARLSAILNDTKTPHLADRSTRGPNGVGGTKTPRFGLRYCDRRVALDAQLLPFVSEDAKKAWRLEADERRQEQHAVLEAARRLTGPTTIQEALKILPEPKEPGQPGEEGLQDKRDSAISPVRPSTPHKDNSR